MIFMFTFTLSQTLAFMYLTEVLKFLFKSCLIAASAWLCLRILRDILKSDL